MKCDKCKINEAVIFIGYLGNNRQKNMAICESCSDLMGITAYMQNEDDNSYNLEETYQFSVNHNIQCPFCHTEISHVLSTGQMGCPQCYLVFKNEIDRFFGVKANMDENRYELPETLRDRLNEFIEN